MSNFIYDFVIITIVGGVIVGLILLVFNKIDFKNLFLKRRIRRLLKKYKDIKLIPEKERNFVRKFGQLLDNGKRKLINLGFGFTDDDVTIQNDLFKIHITRVGNSRIIDRFLLTRLEDNGVYYSERYPEPKKENNDPSVLSNFIEYLEE